MPPPSPSWAESLARLRINPHYLRQQERAEKFIKELPLVGTQVERALDAVKAGCARNLGADDVLRAPRGALHRPL